jgi:hypothetical protein
MKILVTERQIKILTNYILSEQKVSGAPVKAQFVDTDVVNFFNILESIDTPIQEEKVGEIKYQQQVEAVQIGLLILGYQLPKRGVDGLFGPETGVAIAKYKQDNNIKDSINEVMTPIGSEVDDVMTVDSDTYRDPVNKALLDDIKKAADNAGLKVTITTASTGHDQMTKSGNTSRHSYGAAIDIAIINGVGSKDPKFKEYGNRLRDELVRMGYSNNVESGKDKAVLWQTSGHYGHLHVSNIVGVKDKSTISRKPETIDTIFVQNMIQKLKTKNITSEVLAKYVDPTIRKGGGDFMEIDLLTNEGYDKYYKVANNYITRYNPKALVNGKMLADAAKDTLILTGKYVPVELALAQLTEEGGLNPNTSVRPIRTKNPFNIGNTETKSRTFNSFEDGVKAYYLTIAKNYISHKRNVNLLLKDFTNNAGYRYAQNPNYERNLNKIIRSIPKT